MFDTVWEHFPRGGENPYCAQFAAILGFKASHASSPWTMQSHGCSPRANRDEVAIRWEWLGDSKLDSGGLSGKLNQYAFQKSTPAKLTSPEGIGTVV